MPKRNKSQFVPPEIRITLNHMQAGIVAMLDEHMINYSEEIKAGVKKAVDDFNVEKEVYRIAKRELYSAIQTSISQEISKAIVSANLGNMIGRVLTRAIDSMEGVD